MLRCLFSWKAVGILACVCWVIFGLVFILVQSSIEFYHPGEPTARFPQGLVLIWFIGLMFILVWLCTRYDAAFSDD